jgi:hypothetical protein
MKRRDNMKFHQVLVRITSAVSRSVTQTNRVIPMSIVIQQSKNTP